MMLQIKFILHVNSRRIIFILKDILHVEILETCIIKEVNILIALLYSIILLKYCAKLFVGFFTWVPFLHNFIRVVKANRVVGFDFFLFFTLEL